MINFRKTALASLVGIAGIASLGSLQNKTNPNEIGKSLDARIREFTIERSINLNNFNLENPREKRNNENRGTKKYSFADVNMRTSASGHSYLWIAEDKIISVMNSPIKDWWMMIGDENNFKGLCNVQLWYPASAEDEFPKFYDEAKQNPFDERFFWANPRMLKINFYPIKGIDTFLSYEDADKTPDKVNFLIDEEIVNFYNEFYNQERAIIERENQKEENINVK